MASVPTSPTSYRGEPFPVLDDVPVIDASESFSGVVKKVSGYIARAIDSAYTYEQLRTSVAAQKLRPLLSSLTEECHHQAIVCALL